MINSTQDTGFGCRIVRFIECKLRLGNERFDSG